MPYKSAAQRGWMHIHEPGIAAKWDAEIHAKKHGGYKRQMKRRKKE